MCVREQLSTLRQCCAVRCVQVLDDNFSVCVRAPTVLQCTPSPQGYTIPLDKRLAADGRGLQEHTINDNFAKLAQALYMADREVWGV